MIPEGRVRNKTVLYPKDYFEHSSEGKGRAGGRRKGKGIGSAAHRSFKGIKKDEVSRMILC